MHSLPLFHRIAGQTVIVLGEGEAAMAKRRLVERAGGIVSSDEMADARLAFVALDAPEAAAARLKARGVLVNVVDRPELCQFTVPSLLERGAVLVAVGTGGVSAGLAKALRMRLEAVLPQSLGQLAAALGAARDALRRRWPAMAERRHQIDRALTRGGLADPLEEFDAARFAAWLEDDALSASADAIAEFTVSSDDPDDLALRQARWLASADLVVHDAAVAPAILNLARADAARVLAGQPVAAVSGLTVIIHRG
jgi:uroporphyrin-III C-methyltransferase/precorrin-2 dehydrogenase/sirohydrochlorin ferrochelatase